MWLLCERSLPSTTHAGPHTHTRVASDAEPDRFYQDSLAAAFGGTTTFLAFNNPGTGSSAAAHRSILAGIEEVRRVTASDSAVDYALSPAILGGMHDPLAELPAMVDEGVPTAKAFMVFDFRLADRSIFEAMRILGERGGMLEVHCEDPVLIDAAVEAALQRGDTSPRHHAATRSTEAEAVATHRAMAFARAADAPVHVVHLSCATALRYVAEARATGVRATAETCPHYLVLTDARYDWPRQCRDRFDQVPTQVCHEWNTVAHLNDYEGRPARRPLTYDELQRLFDFVDSRVDRIAGSGRKGALAAFRDAAQNRS